MPSCSPWIDSFVNVENFANSKADPKLRGLLESAKLVLDQKVEQLLIA